METKEKMRPRTREELERLSHAELVKEALRIAELLSEKEKTKNR